MEAVMMNSTGDYKHRIGNPKRNFGSNRTLFPYPSDDLLFLSSLAGARFDGGGLLSMPPSYSSLPHSYLPAVSGFLPPQNLHQFRQQPPLLPLPISMPVNHHNISRSNSTANNNIRLSSAQINKNTKTRGRDHSLTPKKSKNQKKNSKKEEADPRRPATAEEKEAPPAPPAPSAVNRLTESSIEPITGPDLKDLPKEVNPRVSSSSINKSCDTVSFHFDNFSGPVSFTPSPPPSSVPLPNFLLRSKLSCKAEASAGTTASEDGATDNLRRLLRL